MPAGPLIAPLGPLQVTLLDGRSVSSWSPEWRAETLARHLKVGAILPLPDREARRAALHATMAAALSRSEHGAGVIIACGVEPELAPDILVVDGRPFDRERAAALALADLCNLAAPCADPYLDPPRGAQWKRELNRAGPKGRRR